MPNLFRGTATTSSVSRVNRTAILEVLRQHGALSRQQIESTTGLSPATVNRLTASLISEQLVVPDGRAPSTGGRPSVLLRYTGSSRVVAAIQLRADGAHGALVDFDGVFIHRLSRTFEDLDASKGREKAARDARLQRTLELFDSLATTAIERGTECLSLGLSVPGAVEHPSGKIGHMHELDFPDVALTDLLRAHTGLPVVVENDANAMAFGELQRGVGRGSSSLVVLHLGSGLGAGIVTNGVLHRGFRGEAGEVGYLLMERSSLANTFPAFGDLESRIGALALTKIARDRGMIVPEGKLLVVEDIFDLARDGDAVAEGMAGEVLDMIAMAVAAMSIVLDPEMVILGGNSAINSNVIIPGVLDRLTGRILRVPRLESATFVDDAVIVGAAELAAHSVRGLTYLAG